MAEGRVTTFAEGELVVKLLDEQWAEEEVWMVIKMTQDYDEALLLLQQDCELCAGTMTLKQIVKMPHCDHKCCQVQALAFYEVKFGILIS